MSEHLHPNPDQAASRRTLDQLSPEVKPLAEAASRQIVMICHRLGIESTSTGDLSQQVLDVMKQFREKLAAGDRSLMKEANQLIDLQELLTSVHKRNRLPEHSKYISQTKEEALSGDSLIHEGDLDLSDLTSIEGLTLPQTIKGNLNLSSLTSAKGLTLPQTIGKDLYLYNLTSIEGLIFPQTIGGDFILDSIDSAEGLIFPQTIGGSLYFRNLTSAKGLILPRSIKGSLYLNRLTSAKGLVLAETVQGDIYLDMLPKEEKAKLRQTYKHLADKII